MMPNKNQIFQWIIKLFCQRFGADICLLRKDNDVELLMNGKQKKIIFKNFCNSLDHGKWENFSSFNPAEHFEKFSDFNIGLITPGNTDNKPCSIDLNGNIVFEYDILGLIFWVMSRREELENKTVDEHGRFSFFSSHSYRFDYYSRPVIDEWFLFLDRCFGLLFQRNLLVLNQFSIRVSHDVDLVSRYAFTDYFTFFRRVIADTAKRDRRSLYKAMRVRMNSVDELHPEDPFNNFGNLMGISEKFGLESTFFFLSGRANKIYDADYDIYDTPIIDLMKKISERGHYIAWHPSYNSFRSPQRLRQEALRFKDVCEANSIAIGKFRSRMHYLRIRVAETFDTLDLLGIDEEETLGFPEHSAFRAGTCRPFPAVHPISGSPLSFEVIPLLLMDVTMLSPSYMGLCKESILTHAADMAKICKKYGGALTLLWHNHTRQDVVTFEEILTAIINQN